jgi:hypothetical protein
MVAAADPTPPPLSHDQVAILNAFITSNYDLAATAASANLTLPDLLAWHRAPAVQAALDDLESLQARADELQLAAARRDAVKELHGILRDAESDPVERRRAATALLRRNRGIGFQPMSTKRGQPPLGAAATSRAAPAPTVSERTGGRRQPPTIAADTPDRPRHTDTQSPATSEISNLKSAISPSSDPPSHDPEEPWMPGPDEDPFLTGDAAPLPHLAPYFAELQARRRSAANNSG